MLEIHLDKAHRAFFESGIAEIIKHRGADHQWLKLVEEMSELTQSVTKYANGSRALAVYDNRSEEFADVLVVMHQLFSIMTPDQRKRVIDTALYKVKRELERIEDEKRGLYR
jgi:NTP pyrophosphatase (non-canonical NTP hydrolase)